MHLIASSVRMRAVGKEATRWGESAGKRSSASTRILGAPSIADISWPAERLAGPLVSGLDAWLLTCLRLWPRAWPRAWLLAWLFAWLLAWLCQTHAVVACMFRDFTSFK